MGNLASRIGQRPILVVGGLMYACAGLWRVAMLGPDANYLVDYFPSMILSGLGVACIFPQLSSLVAQALPQGRSGVGGAVLQAGRQFGGTVGVALTIALLGTGGVDTLARFDRIWWLLVIGGLATSVLVLPTRAYLAPWPSSARTTVPVTNSDAGEHKNSNVESS
jgi:MFS family permease